MRRKEPWNSMGTGPHRHFQVGAAPSLIGPSAGNTAGRSVRDRQRRCSALRSTLGKVRAPNEGETVWTGTMDSLDWAWVGLHVPVCCMR